VFDEGSGPPIVVVQPLQGRWEWTRPLLRGQARTNRVISYSLCGDLGSRRKADGGFDDYIAQLRDVMDAAGVRETALFGISFGGTVATHFAAEFPDRVTSLVIASSPGPGWKANAVQAGYVTRPWLSMPAFALGALTRVMPEMNAAIESWTARATFVLKYGAIVLRYPMLPHLMARRVRHMEGLDLAADCRQIHCPTLVLTGDNELDHVVPVESTKRYVGCINGARYLLMENTGHLGVLTRPQRFADVVSEFVNASHS
jgi:pimeloyl-ACP methyl ester carboxylesterase